MKFANKVICYVVVALITLMGAIAGYIAIRVKMIPISFVVLGIGIYLIIAVSVILFAQLGKSNGWSILAAILCVLLLALTVPTSIYLLETKSILSRNMDVHIETTEIAIYVEKDDLAENLEDVLDYRFGILAELDRGNTDYVIDELVCQKGEYATTVDSKNQAIPSNQDELTIMEYPELTALLDGMMTNEVQVLILNEGYMAILREWNSVVDEELTTSIDQTDYESYSQSLRKLGSFQIEWEIGADEVYISWNNSNAGEIEMDSGSSSSLFGGNRGAGENDRIKEGDKAVSEVGLFSDTMRNDKLGNSSGENGGTTSERKKIAATNGSPLTTPGFVPPESQSLTYAETGCFILYISGQDAWGGVNSQSRSDVNILAVVNTNTHKVMLISTPRDYYLPLPVANGAKDKLTHAGIYGVDSSRSTLMGLYGYNIDYYFKLNFSGFEAIIDALGGITVWSNYDFTVEPIKHYVQGDNSLTGLETLAFARERHALPGGDHDRGRHQMNVIVSLINKLCSTAILGNYTEVLQSLSSAYITDMPYNTVATLISNQISTGADWDIRTYAVSGTGGSECTYSAGSQKRYVMHPNWETVEEAKQLIGQTLEGTLE